MKIACIGDMHGEFIEPEKSDIINCARKWRYFDYENFYS